MRSERLTSLSGATSSGVRLKRRWLLSLPACCAVALGCAASFVSAEEPKLRFVEAQEGVSRAVIVGPAALVHTAQLMSPDAGPLEQQLQQTLSQTDAALKSAGSSLAQAVKLNFYVSDDAAAPAVLAALARTFSQAHQPAVTLVTTTLPNPKALVALDAVAVASTNSSGPGQPASAASAPAAERFGGRVGRAWAILPPGPRVYISGQAEAGDGTLADATRQTLSSLGRTLEFLELKPADVVQVKCFLTPQSRVAECEAELARYFGSGGNSADGALQTPPAAFVEWQSKLPIEIELVVAAAAQPKLTEGPKVEVRTPLGMTTPTIYSRLTITRHPSTIYLGGLYPQDPQAAAEPQLRSLFSGLKQTLDASGSDWVHLIKATYYVARRSEPAA